MLVLGAHTGQRPAPVALGFVGVSQIYHQLDGQFAGYERGGVRGDVLQGVAAE